MTAAREGTAGARHPRCCQRRELTTKGRARQRVQDVEGHDAVRRDTVHGGGQDQFGHDAAARPGQHGHDNPIDPIGDGVAGEDEYRPITAVGSSCEPDVTPLHGRADQPTPPSPPSPRPDPSHPRRRGRSRPR